MAELKLEKIFDAKRKRHYLNGFLTVLHCHHYATLFTQLAVDAKELVEGTVILRETSEDIFFQVLSRYYKENGVTGDKERLDIAGKMYSALGMGTLDILSGNAQGGEVDVPHAHVDDGWIKKWGQYNEPVNYIGAGYIAAMFAAAFDKPIRSYRVVETLSRVKGDAKSHFKVSV